jgi:bifunctional N-acetylglucosamine-1-phosphate-uridyltransferase/glucosamine-1-phosphate-acetyltransferase GlmU-like protein
MKEFLFTVFLIVLIIDQPMAQQRLIVASREKIKAEFYLGDEIRIATKQNSRFRSYQITGFIEHAVLLNSDTIYIHDIIRIALHEKKSNRLRAAGIKVLTAAFVLPLGDFITVTVVQNQDYEVHRGVAIVSAGLFIGGMVMILVKPQVRINRKNRMMLIN